MVASIKKIYIRVGGGRGFTLVEMSLYVAICSLILFSLSSFFSFLAESRVKSQAISEVNQQGFFVMNTITSAIRNARTIDVPGIGTSSTTLSITTQDALTSPSVFSLSSSTLMIKEGSAAPVALTNSRISVSPILFENVSSSSSTDRIVRISFTLFSRTTNSQQQYNYTKTFKGSATLR